jgi:hypothetical protein
MCLLSGCHSYYEWLRAQFTHKRGILEAGLCAAGIEPLPSTGGYFLMGRLPDVPSVKQVLLCICAYILQWGLSGLYFVSRAGWITATR